MTHEEGRWRACFTLPSMLTLLNGRASQRKLCLFAVACCRRISHLFRDQRSADAVEVSERYADGLATALEVEWAANRATDAWEQSQWDRSAEEIQAAARAVSGLGLVLDPQGVATRAAQAVGCAAFWSVPDGG